MHSLVEISQPGLEGWLDFGGGLVKAGEGPATRDRQAGQHVASFPLQLGPGGVHFAVHITIDWRQDVNRCAQRSAFSRALNLEIEVFARRNPRRISHPKLEVYLSPL